MIADFAGFAALAWRKPAIVRALQPEVRWDRPGKRYMRLLSMGVGQARMIAGEFKPRLMHAAIFLGFCALLVRKLHLIVMGYDPLVVIPGAAGGPKALGLTGLDIALFGEWLPSVPRVPPGE